MKANDIKEKINHLYEVREDVIRLHKFSVLHLVDEDIQGACLTMFLEDLTSSIEDIINDEISRLEEIINNADVKID